MAPRFIESIVELETFHLSEFSFYPALQVPRREDDSQSQLVLTSEVFEGISVPERRGCLKHLRTKSNPPSAGGRGRVFAILQNKSILMSLSSDSDPVSRQCCGTCGMQAHRRKLSEENSFVRISSHVNLGDDPCRDPRRDRYFTEQPVGRSDASLTR